MSGAMLSSETWAALDSLNEQVVFLYDLISKESGTTLFSAALGRVSEIQESHIRTIHCKAKTKPYAWHRRLALDSDEENVVICLIETGHAKENLLTLRNVLKFVEIEFAKCLT
jgi:hypothetical protein